MHVFTIALLGAPDTGQSQLFTALTCRLKVYAPPVSVLVTDPALSSSCDVILLMGLSSPQACEASAADQLIRLALAHAGSAYEVLYGSHQERLAQAIQSVEKRFVNPSALPVRPRDPTGARQKPWVWNCDKCSDPQCEHKLLTQLLTQRATAP